MYHFLLVKSLSQDGQHFLFDDRGCEDVDFWRSGYSLSIMSCPRLGDLVDTCCLGIEGQDLVFPSWRFERRLLRGVEIMNLDLLSTLYPTLEL